MRCKRCSGLMVVEPIYDATGSPMSGEPQSARCLNCGNIEDDVICINRLEPIQPSETTFHYAGVEIELW